jgi:hypothetical protein
MSNYTTGPGPLDGSKRRLKLNDKIKALNSSRVFKKITPKGDLSWYVKWISVVLIVIATAARSQGGIPHIDLWFGLLGTLGWLWVGMLWHDRALILLNGVLVTLIGIGLMNFYTGI